MESIATREAYGKTLVELVENKDIVVLDADLAGATKTAMFKKACPERFFDMGIAEGDMMGTAAGLAVSGKIPFASTFAIFAAGRGFEQIRNSICYPNINVKIAATHAGVTVGEDGGSHQAIEDISLMRSLPNMVVLNPADAVEARQMVLAAAEYVGPMYLRFGRAATPVIHDESYKFELGKGEVVKEGKDVSIIATGIMVAKALEAAETLKAEGIDAEVINISTIKPLDNELVLASAKKTGKVVTAEEHSIIGGLGSAVCELLAEEYPVKVTRIGVKDVFGQSGTPAALLEHYGLTAADIVKACK
ncbi:transketolase family protein [Peptacetobacter sp.]|uniref:transketolase family protein n=1 Tax=unclassified Peptacetobacter TaxID=2991974 RepID=UPI0026029DC3|nr:transketolase family protein [Peptacetobacter sp.]MEE0452174.1 transketolase family protein [Peptacetobacter sp.]